MTQRFYISPTADSVPFDNDTNGFTADNVQEAIEELSTNVRSMVNRNANQSISHNTNTNITFPTEVFDDFNMHSTSTNTDRITIPTGYDGFYLIHYGLEYAGNTAGYRFFQITVNNTETNNADGIRLETITSSLDLWQSSSSTVKLLAAGDIVRLRTKQKSGSSLNCISAYLAVTRIQK